MLSSVLSTRAGLRHGREQLLPADERQQSVQAHPSCDQGRFTYWSSVSGWQSHFCANPAQSPLSGFIMQDKPTPVTWGEWEVINILKVTEDAV